MSLRGAGGMSKIQSHGQGHQRIRSFDERDEVGEC